MPVLSLDFVLHCYTCGRKQKSGPIKLTETFSAAVIGNCWIQWNYQGCGTWFCFFEHRYHKRFNVGPARLGCVLELGSKRNIFPGPLVCVSGISPRQDCKGVAGPSKRLLRYCRIYPHDLYLYRRIVYVFGVALVFINIRLRQITVHVCQSQKLKRC